MAMGTTGVGQEANANGGGERFRPHESYTTSDETQVEQNETSAEGGISAEDLVEIPLEGVDKHRQDGSSPLREKKLVDEETGGGGRDVEAGIVPMEKKYSGDSLQSSESGQFCRVCQQAADEELVPLGCDCRGEMGMAHRSCIVLWFTRKGSNKCEICQKHAVNIPLPMVSGDTVESSNAVTRIMYVSPMQMSRCKVVLIIFLLAAVFDAALTLIFVSPTFPVPAISTFFAAVAVFIATLIIVRYVMDHCRRQRAEERERAVAEAQRDRSQTPPEVDE